LVESNEWEVIQSSLFLIKSILEEISTAEVLMSIFNRLEHLFIALLNPK
jgi:hypothetical protein